MDQAVRGGGGEEGRGRREVRETTLHRQQREQGVCTWTRREGAEGERERGRMTT